MARDYASKLSQLRQDLEVYSEQRRQIITTGQSWQLRNGDDSRSLTNVSLNQLNQLIDRTERDIAALEAIVEGGSARGVRVRPDAI